MNTERNELEKQVPDFCKGLSTRVLHALMQEYEEEINEPYFKRQLYEDLFCYPSRHIPNLGKVGIDQILTVLGSYEDLPKPKGERFSKEELVIKETKEGDFIYLELVYNGRPYRVTKDTCRENLEIKLC